MNDTLISEKCQVVTNELFLKTIFGDQYQQAHVCSFTQDPSAIPTGESRRCWAGGFFRDQYLIPDSNQYYTVSLFQPENGRANRRRINFRASYILGLDDCREKLPEDQLKRLPAPSIVLKSSLYSEQWLYLLQTPETNPDRIDALHDGLIQSDLVPSGTDPGQRGVTRYLRLPEGCNTKASRIQENNGIAPRCEIVEWHPERRYSLEQLAAPFDIDLGKPRAVKSDGAAQVDGHPVLEHVHVKEVRSPGRYDISCPWVDEHTGADDSGSAVFTNSDGTIGFACHHGSCQHRTGADLLDYVEKMQPGFKEELKMWQMQRELPTVESDQTEIKTENVMSPLERLQSMVTGSQTMFRQMENDKYILKDLALEGQWTLFYAGPNTGKTLLTLWLLKEAIATKQINGKDVYFINADDTFKGGAQKVKMAEEAGYNMILSNSKGFRAETILDLISELTESGESKGKVLILDTIKKFTDLMDKKISSKFGNIARNFVASGGTLIGLAHTNKHKNSDGESVYAGTSDLRDDADCVYIAEHRGKISTGSCAERHTVEFVNSKMRGDVSQSVTFTYVKEKGISYQTLFNSVERHDGPMAKVVKEQTKAAHEMQKDSTAVEGVRTALENGVNAKTKIVEFVTDTSNVTRNQVRDILKKYEGQLWTTESGEHNKSIYNLVKPPSLPEVSFI